MQFGETKHASKDNGIAVPQCVGGVFSPTLSNSALAHLTFGLEKVVGLHFMIYADDVSLCTFRGPTKTQEKILQKGMILVEDFVYQVGLQVSAEESEFLLARTSLPKRCTAQERKCLRLDDKDIP